MSNAPPRIFLARLCADLPDWREPTRWSYVTIPPGTHDPVTARCSHQGQGQPAEVVLDLHRFVIGRTATYLWLGRCSCGNGIWSTQPAPDEAG